jgi:hypothetical protein
MDGSGSAADSASSVSPTTAFLVAAGQARPQTHNRRPVAHTSRPEPHQPAMGGLFRLGGAATHLPANIKHGFQEVRFVDSN